MNWHFEVAFEKILSQLGKVNSFFAADLVKRKLKYLENILVIFASIGLFFSVMAPLTVHAENTKSKETFNAAKIMDTSQKGSEVVTDDKNPNIVTTDSSQFDSTIIMLAYKLGGTKPFEATAEQRLAAEKLPFSVRYGITGVATTQMIYALYNQPSINIPSYMAYEWSPTYHNQQELMAATYSNGYSFLKATGIAGLWNITRNMSYLFLAIILVVSGFMVMFRQKINGQVMVSIYNTIPNIIIALILITFSFAIVGLLININTTIVYSLAKAFFPTEYRDAYFDGVGDGILGNFGTFSETANYIIFPSSVANFLNGVLGGASLSIEMIASLVIAIVTTFLVEIPVIGPVIAGAGWVSVLFFNFLLLITIIVSFKLYFAILKQYFMLLLNIILMPLAIAFGALPGQGHLTKNIFFKIIKNLLSMQFITFFVNLAIFLSTTPSLNISIFKGAYLGGGDIQLKGSGTSFIIRLYLFYYLLFFAANVPNLLDDWLKTDVAKGAEKAVQMTSQQMGKIPVLGSLFKKVG